MAYEIKNVDELINMLKLPACVVMFRLEGCIHCHHYLPTFEAVADENKDVNSYVVENEIITKYMQTSRPYSFIENIKGFPYSCLVQGGKQRKEEVRGAGNRTDTLAMFFGAKQAIGYVPARFAVSEDDAMQRCGKSTKRVRARETYDKCALDALHDKCVIVLI